MEDKTLMVLQRILSDEEFQLLRKIIEKKGRLKEGENV
jgi:hypothetical protein